MISVVWILLFEAEKNESTKCFCHFWKYFVYVSASIGKRFSYIKKTPFIFNDRNTHIPVQSLQLAKGLLTLLSKLNPHHFKIFSLAIYVRFQDRYITHSWRLILSENSYAYPSFKCIAEVKEFLIFHIKSVLYDIIGHYILIIRNYKEYGGAG